MNTECHFEMNFDKVFSTFFGKKGMVLKQVY